MFEGIKQNKKNNRISTLHCSTRGADIPYVFTPRLYSDHSTLYHDFYRTQKLILYIINRVVLDRFTNFKQNGSYCRKLIQFVLFS